MKIAFIADLHGNRPAVEALEQDLKRTQPDLIYCLGDIVGKGPSSDFTYDWAMANCQLILGGNWDFGVGEKRFPRDDYYWNQLGEEKLKVLRELPLEHEFVMCGRRIRLFHGRPVMDVLIKSNDDASLIYPFFYDEQGERYDMVIYADAHRQAMRTMTPGMFVNVGSVGNGLGEPRCCYAILEGDQDDPSSPLEIRFRQIGYNRDQAVADAQAAPDVPWIEAYIQEVETGLYSRNMMVSAKG